MKSIAELEARLCSPSPALIDDMKSIEGNILVLGAGGKMGPSLATLAANAARAAGSRSRVIAVSRFSEPGLPEGLRATGVDTVSADLLDEGDLAALPEAPNILYMAGRKFGTTGQEHLTWAMNAYLPGRVASRFPQSRIVVFSSGNVYPFVPVDSGGATEAIPPGPVGEYAQSCLARERVFQHFSHALGTPMLIFRLNYAIDMRYGNLLEIARMVIDGRTIDLTVGHMNVIWQGDANEVAIRSLLHCTTPPRILNVTGPETVSIRWVAEEFGRIFGRTPVFSGGEASCPCLLSNASACHGEFGPPRVSLREMIAMTAEWIRHGGPTLDKPTHFQETAGRY